MGIESNRMVRILLVDDHPGIRYGVRQIIERAPDLSVCGEADTLESALQAVRSSADLAIVDLSLGRANGLDLIRNLLQIDATMPTLVLSTHEELLFAELALRAGARGFVMKQDADDHLLHAIREVLAGRRYVSQRVIQQILARIAPSP
jgi:DNA-binding NarL/FixJ family response regulator